MTIKILNNAAFSLMEVLMAALIFIISVAGVLVTLNAVRVPVLDKENELASVVFGKQVLEALYSNVNANTVATNTYNSCQTPNGDGSCGDFSLYPGMHEVTLPWPAGCVEPACVLTMPSALTGCNANLSYTVFCANGIAASGTPLACSNSGVARGVTLNIKWPNVALGTC